MTPQKAFNHLIAFFSMCAGSTLVFAGVMYMNAQEKPPKEPPKESITEFQVDKKPPPKKKKERQREPKPRPQKAVAQAPKAPDLSANISSVALDLSGTSSLSLGNVSKDLIGSFDKKAPMAEGSLDTPPKLRARAGSQEYPSSARKDGVEGYVLLNIYVKGDGTVGTVKVLDASPRGVFEESARSFVSEWAFEAGTYEGQSVDAWVKQKVVYKLQRG
jgi:protein TonB